MAIAPIISNFDYIDLIDACQATFGNNLRRCSMKPIACFVFAICLTMKCTSVALADETRVEDVNLPGASLSQEVTYHPSKEEYEHVRVDTLERLKAGHSSALVNPRNGPWKRVETTAKIGFEYKGVGTSSGRKLLRQISAAEDALFEFDKTKR
jgi:hypothetical protein